MILWKLLKIAGFRIVKFSTNQSVYANGRALDHKAHSTSQLQKHAMGTALLLSCCKEKLPLTAQTLARGLQSGERRGEETVGAVDVRI